MSQVLPHLQGLASSACVHQLHGAHAMSLNILVHKASRYHKLTKRVWELHGIQKALKGQEQCPTRSLHAPVLRCKTAWSFAWQSCAGITRQNLS